MHSLDIFVYYLKLKCFWNEKKKLQESKKDKDSNNKMNNVSGNHISDENVFILLKSILMSKVKQNMIFINIDKKDKKKKKKTSSINTNMLCTSKALGVYLSSLVFLYIKNLLIEQSRKQIWMNLVLIYRKIS